MERERHKVMYKHAQASSYATRSANRCGEEIPLKGMFRAICFCKRKLFFSPLFRKPTEASHILIHIRYF